MKELWFGGWHNFYDVNWPVRFLIELTIHVVIIVIVIKVIKRIIPVKKWLIKGFVWFAKEIIHLIGRSREWAVRADNKITDWGVTAINNTDGKYHPKRKLLLYILLGALYVSAVFVDLPISENLQEESLTGLVKVKSFFQQIESRLSNGYENYKPLIKEEVFVPVKLSNKVKKSVKIRKKPSLNGKVIGSATKSTEILYQNECKRDGERYWLKVYLPGDKIEGWLNGKQIVEEQLNELVEKTET